MAFDNLPSDPQQEGDERESMWHRPVNAEQGGRLPEGFGVVPAVSLAVIEEAGDAAPAAPQLRWRHFWQRKAPAMAAAMLLLAGVVAGSGVTYGVMQSRKPPLFSQASGTNPRPVAYAAAGNLTGLYQATAPSVVRITETSKVATVFGSMNESGVGTGIVIDKEGHILTNNHVVSDGGKILVEFFGGKKIEGVVMGSDAGDDLAMIKVDPAGLDLHPAELGDSDQVQVGQPVVALGNPFGDYGWSISSGIISGKDRPLNTASGRGIKGLIQTDAAINPGNSGGPLLDLDGRVVGINTAIESPVKGSVGIGFAIPINLARSVMGDLVKGDQVKHPWVGVSLQAITPEVKDQLALSVSKGLLLEQIFTGSPAENAGLRRTYSKNGKVVLGDIITGVDSLNIEQPEDLINYVGKKKVGDKVMLHVIRDGKATDISLLLGAWPKQLQNNGQ